MARYVVSGRAVDVAPTSATPPITVVACTNDDAQLAHNLLASPCLVDGRHEVLLYAGMTSAAEGLNRGIEEASNDVVVLVHQDVYLPGWWPAQLWAQWEAAAAAGGPVGVGAAFGVRYRKTDRTSVGHVVDRDRLLWKPTPLPADVDTVDEMLLVVPRVTPLRFEPALGWDLYGADFALQAHAAGLRAVVLDVPCFHNSLRAGLGISYSESAAVLASKWVDEAVIVTSCSTIVATGRRRRRVHVDEDPGGRSATLFATVDAARREEWSMARTHAWAALRRGRRGRDVARLVVAVIRPLARHRWSPRPFPPATGPR